MEEDELQPADRPAEAERSPSSEKQPKTAHPFWRGFVQTVLVFVVLAAAVAGMRYMAATAPEGPKRPPSEQVYTVETQTVTFGSHQPDFSVFGTTIAGKTVELRALVAGEIVSISDDVEVGRRVKTGETLVTLDDFPYRGALTEARANLREAEATLTERQASVRAEEVAVSRAQEQLELARTDLQRAEQLRTRGTGTQQSLDERQLILSQRAQALEERQANLEVARARLEQQQAVNDRLRWRVEEAERNLADTVLKAPFDGVVMNETAGLGRKVSASDLLVELYREGSVEARFVVSDRQFGRLLSDSEGVIGREVDITWTVGGKPLVYKGTIDRIGAEVVADRGGVELFANVKDGPEVDLRPGAFVEVSVPDRTWQNAVRLPETALFGGNAVFVVEDGRLQRRPVEVAAYDGADVIVTSGLAEGETVMTTQIADAREGIKVAKPGENKRISPTMSMGHGS